MADGPVIAISGASGSLGGAVARMLAERDVPLRLLVRRRGAAPQLRRSEARVASYDDHDAARAALTGVQTLLMVSAAESADRLTEHRTFVDAAADAGVRHVVYTSFAGAAPDAVFTLARDHAATEQHLRGSGMTWTFLRDALYADFLEAMVGPDDVLRGPAGDGRAAVVARADVARSAAAVLLEPAAHAGRTYDLTGPEALSLAEVAATISRVRGREIRYVDETLDEAYASRAGYGAPDWQVEAWVSTYTAIASGVMATVSGDVERLTGTAPVRLEDLLRSTPPPAG